METDAQPDVQEQAPEAVQEPEKAPEAPVGQDQSAIMNRLDALSKEFAQTQSQQQQQLPGQEAQQFDEFAPDQFDGQPQFDQFTGQPLEQNYQDGGLDPQRIQKMIQDGINEAVGPMQAERQHEQILDLEDQYPDLKKPEVAQATLDRAMQLAQRLGQPERATDPEFLETIYLAERARGRAASEVPAGEEASVELESGAAAAAQGEPELSEADRIVAASPRDPFWDNRGWN